MNRFFSGFNWCHYCGIITIRCIVKKPQMWRVKFVGNPSAWKLILKNICFLILINRRDYHSENSVNIAVNGFWPRAVRFLNQVFIPLLTTLNYFVPITIILSTSGIYYHEKIHTSGVQKCEQCQTELKNKLALLAHVRKYHREPKYKCNYCHKTFEISSKLKVIFLPEKFQIRYFNWLSYKHSCINLFLYQEHEEGHTRHKIYPCQYCSKTFSVQSSRQTHVRRTHPAELKQRKEMRKQLETPIVANPNQNTWNVIYLDFLDFLKKCSIFLLSLWNGIFILWKEKFYYIRLINSK